ncbi:MAG: hypothetical protein J2P24_07195 [Streptosporangiales bacterium]|nr:hypothetical protein [Streptosporangiales bacterium]MBO0892637.1 hypothetical protein [Acidothermales bacterium]
MALGDERHDVVRVRVWWQATVIGLMLGAVSGTCYGAVIWLLPLSGRVWFASFSLAQALLAGAGLGLCYGAAAGLAGGITLAVDARLAPRDPTGRSGLKVSAGAAVAAVIGVVVAFLLIALLAWVVRHGVDLSDLTLLMLVGVPALLAGSGAAVVARLMFRPVSV